MEQRGAVGFDRFILDLGDARLLGPSGPVAVGNKALRVLSVLVEAEGRLVSKDMLFDRAWDGVAVTESALTSVIKELRRALDDPPRNPRFIESVYGKGYRFLVPVRAAVPSPEPLPVAPETAGDGLTTVGNLPAPMIELVGREHDLVALDERLAACGLVSLIGPGGVGKTSLALEAARRRAGRYLDGAWLVELAPLGEARHIPYAVAGAMEFELTTTGNARDGVIERLRRREGLLVIDNAEHLVEGVAEFARAIRVAAPGMTLLVTSQEALGVAGEQVMPLGPLAEGDARELFVARALAAAPGFALGDGNLGLIDRICQRVDHMPLAIEMAAARSPTLGCAAVLGRLDDRFALLTRGQRGVDPRHRTLLATLEWSHDLLSPVERTAFRRLGVFAGSFSLDAATAIAGLDDLEEGDALDAIASLVTKSLLVARAGGIGMRYRMLETMRAFALRHLAEAGEMAKARRCHALWYAEATQPIWRDYVSHLSDAELEQRHGIEHDNVTAAVNWAYGEDGDAEIGHRVVAHSWVLWPERLLWRMLPGAIARTGRDTPADVRASLLAAHAHVAMRMNPLEAIRLVDAAIAAKRTVSNDPWALVEALCSKGLSYWFLGQIDEAEAVSRQIGEVMPVMGRSRIGSLAKGLRACVALSRSGLPAARPIFAEASEDLHAMGAHGLANFWRLSMLQFENGLPLDEQIDAWHALIAAIHPGQQFADGISHAACVELVTRLAMRGRPEDFVQARDLARRCLRRGPMVHEYRFLLAMAVMALRSGRAQDGALLYGHADALRRKMGETQMTAASFRQARELLEQLVEPPLRDRLVGEGEALSGDEARAIALGSSAVQELAS